MRLLRPLVVALALIPGAIADAQGGTDVGSRVPRGAVKRPDAVAVVIGIADYDHRDVPPVRYAIRDAQAVKRYLVHTMGLDEENIIYVENASSAKFREIFGTPSAPEGRLSNYLEPGRRSDVFIYYSGHGAPDLKDGKSFFVPADADPNYIKQGGYGLDDLYAVLRKLPAKSITVFLESCFSGFSDNGTLVKGASPALLKVESPVFSAPNALVLTASANTQIASWHEEAQHGLFTYYLLKGLQGEADADANRTVTGTELAAFVERQVSRHARRDRGREQTPQVGGGAKARAVATLTGQFAELDALATVGGAPAAAPVSTAQQGASVVNQPRRADPRPSPPAGTNAAAPVGGGAPLQPQRFVYVATAGKYRQVGTMKATQEMSGQRTPLETTSTSHLDVQLGQGASGLTLTIGVDSMSGTSMGAPIPQLESYRGMSVVAEVSPTGAVLSSRGAGTSVPNSESLVAEMAHFLPRVASDLAMGTTWSDTTVVSTTTGGISIERTVFATYVVSGDTVIAGERAWKVTRSYTSRMTGRGSAGGQTITMGGSSSGNGIIALSPAGIYLGSTVEDRSDVTSVVGAMQMRMTATNTARVEKVR